jgi:hypothetical protein
MCSLTIECVLLLYRYLCTKCHHHFWGSKVSIVRHFVQTSSQLGSSKHVTKNSQKLCSGKLSKLETTALLAVLPAVTEPQKGQDLQDRGRRRTGPRIREDFNAAQTKRLLAVYQMRECKRPALEALASELHGLEGGRQVDMSDIVTWLKNKHNRVKLQGPMAVSPDSADTSAPAPEAASASQADRKRKCKRMRRSGEEECHAPQATRLLEVRSNILLTPPELACHSSLHTPSRVHICFVF